MSTPQQRALAASTAAAFEQRYAAQPDPWQFATSPYEQGRYDEIMRTLARTRYRRAFEPGCAEGALTTRLAARCDEVVATELSLTALARARARCAKQTNIRFSAADIQGALPPGTFDLIVFSEIGYYFTQPVLEEIVVRLRHALDRDGELIAVHWLGHSDDHVLSGDEVHETLLKNLSLVHVAELRHTGFRLDSWARP